jgi:hypothetical protein
MALECAGFVLNDASEAQLHKTVAMVVAFMWRMPVDLSVCIGVTSRVRAGCRSPPAPCILYTGGGEPVSVTQQD